MSTSSIRAELVAVLERDLTDVQVHRTLLEQVTVTPAVVVRRNGYPARAFLEQTQPDPTFDLVCVVDLADTNRGMDLDDVVDEVKRVIDESDDLAVAVATIGAEVVDETVGGMSVLTSTVTVEVLS